MSLSTPKRASPATQAAEAKAAKAAKSASSQQKPTMAETLAAAQGHGPPPPRPATDENVQEVEAYFNKLAVWVQRMVEQAVKTNALGLRATDFEGKSPHCFEALPIRDLDGGGESSSYKAPWLRETARMALASTGRYEAGGNVMWLAVVPRGDEARVLAGNPASFEEIDELVSQFFEPSLTSGEATSTQPQRGEARAWTRMIFPVSLPVGVRDKAELNVHTHWYMEMPLLSGHCYVIAWYFAMGKALATWADAATTKDARTHALARVACLLECGLTATIHAQECRTFMDLGVLSNKVSEQNKSNEKLHSDTFPAFAAKALLIIQSSLDQDPSRNAGNARMSVLQNANVRYNGAAVNRTMFAAIQKFGTTFNSKSIELLRLIERLAGKECITKHYAKLMRLGQLCSKEAEKSPSSSGEELVEYVLSAIYFQLKHVKLIEVTVDWLTAQVPVLLTRRQIVSTVKDLITDLGRTKAGSDMVASVLLPVVEAFESYATFTTEFSCGQGHDDPVEEFKRRHNCDSKVAHLLTDLLFDVLSGMYDVRITEARAAAQGASAAPQGLDNDGLLKAKGFEKYRDLYRFVTVAQSNVDLQSSGVPDTGARQLRRYKSDPQGADEVEAETERKEAFAAIQRHRVRFCEFIAPNDRVMTTNKYQELLENSKVYAFDGRCGESHRLFTFSAELFHEGGDFPWAAPASWEGGMDTILHFFSKQNASADATVAFDGRSRACRKKSMTSWRNGGISASFGCSTPRQKGWAAR